MREFISLGVLTLASFLFVSFILNRGLLNFSRIWMYELMQRPISDDNGEHEGIVGLYALLSLVSLLAVCSGVYVLQDTLSVQMLVAIIVLTVLRAGQSLYAVAKCKFTGSLEQSKANILFDQLTNVLFFGLSIWLMTTIF